MSLPECVQMIKIKNYLEIDFPNMCVTIFETVATVDIPQDFYDYDSGTTGTCVLLHKGDY